MQPLGFTPWLYSVDLGEQLLNLVLDLIIGGLANFISIVPLLTTTDSSASLELLTLIVSGMLLNGIFWSTLAVRFTFGKEIAEPLKNE